MGLFSKKAPDPAETCPRCGGPKSASLALCTTCSMKESGERNPFGLPGSQKEKDMRAQGHKLSQPPPSAPPPGAYPPTPYGGQPYGGQPYPPVPSSSAPAPYAPPGVAAQARPGSFGDPYALNGSNYPLRAKSGLPVRNAAERDVADLLFDQGIVVAYEANVAGHRPAFLVPAKSVVIEIAHDLSPLADWQKAERAAAYRAYGFSPIHVDGRKGGARDEVAKALSALFPDKAW